MGNTPSHTHEPLERGNFQRGKFGDIKNGKSASFRFSKKTPKKMDRLRRSFRDSFRRRKDRVPESSKPHQWQADEEAVRTATCSFPVKYLGCVEVFESRGMQVCEEALKVLRNSRRRAVRGLLHVSGDGLRVADDETKGLIVDQTIEKVSFCAPDRNHERGFSYICRDGTTRRWMCHGFLSVKDSGERLSHAVGCAFAVCLERKQRRDKECGVTMTFDTKNSTFTRTGSFRPQTLTDRLARNNERIVDTPSAVVLPQPKPYNPFAIERPHATLTMLERQGSFRAFSTIGSQSPFKRQMSLRINDLPSNTERQKAFLTTDTNKAVDLALNSYSVSPIAEVSMVKTPTNVNNGTLGADTLNQLCQELTQGLSLLSQSEVTTPFSPTLQNELDAMKLSTEIMKNISSVKLSSPSSTVDSSDFSKSIITTPQYATTRLATISPSAVSVTSNPTHSGQTVEAAERPLPRPEQWLGKIVQNTSPTTSRNPPSLSSVGRTQSLSSISSNTDPFDAEWVAGITKHLTSESPATTTPIHSTNPFITTGTKQAVPQVFQI